MWKWLAFVAALLFGAALVFVFGTGAPAVDRVEYSAATRAAPTAGMCSWRDPKTDMEALFPGATGYRADTVVLSRHKMAIEKRLGRGYHMDSTALYVYRIERQGMVVGTVAVRRVSGPHGAIEIVAALDPERRISGVRIQRVREPEAVARAITDPAWLSRFRGLTADSLSPAPPAGLPSDALDAGLALNNGLRDLLVELEEGESAPTHRHPA